MGGKRKKNATRSSASQFGGCLAEDFPDKSTCFNNKDIISAMLFVFNTNPSIKKEYDAAKQIQDKIYNKFTDINPRFEKGSGYLLGERSVIDKISRLYSLQ